MKRLNESFVGLASELHQVHEQIKVGIFLYEFPYNWNLHE